MIPRIQKAGGSFVGAGRYYLHDKLPEAERGKELSREQMPKTDERVWFTDTRNLMATDPERAFVEMWKTAEDQQWLKRQAGGKTCGRVCEEPVKTLSLAWHKDDQPTPEHMIEAADAFIKHMGWQEHQAVYVGHNDTEHKHIHIILNRVHPETGKTLDDFREYKRAQEWALAYEKEHENVRCVERELRAAEREQRAPDFGRDDERTKNPPEHSPANEHLPHNVVMLARPHEQGFNAEEQARAALFEQERDTLKAEQRAERETWFKDGKQLFKQTRHEVYDEVRKEYAPEWKQLYADAREAEQQAEAWSQNAVTRALWFAAEGQFADMLSAFGDRDAVRDEVSKDLALRKAELKERQNEVLRTRQNEALNELRLSREAEYKQVLQRQRDERAAMQAAHVQGLSAEFVLDGREVAAQPVPGNDLAPTADRPRQAEPQQRAENTAAALADILRDLADSSPVAEALNERRHPPAPERQQAPEQAPDREPQRDGMDLGAGAIGAAAEYVAEQLAELIAPTPPEVRKEREQQEAKREMEREAARSAEPPLSDFWQREVEAALREAERLKEEQRSRDYWEERDRGKERGRDR